MKKIHILLVTFMLMLSSNSHAVLINAYDRGFYSDEGHEDIERLIEEEKLKFLNEEERKIKSKL